MGYFRSTNGTNWNEDEANFDDGDEFPAWGLSANCFFTSQITNYWGSSDIYEPISLDNYWGDAPNTMTNHLPYSTFYVVPNSNTVPNIVYRPFLSLTNFIKPMPLTNSDCHCPGDTTNNPPAP